MSVEETTMALIKVRDVEKHYQLGKTEAPALIGVSLEVRGGRAPLPDGPIRQRQVDPAEYHRMHRQSLRRERRRRRRGHRKAQRREDVALQEQDDGLHLPELQPDSRPLRLRERGVSPPPPRPCRRRTGRTGSWTSSRRSGSPTSGGEARRIFPAVSASGSP